MADSAEVVSAMSTARHPGSPQAWRSLCIDCRLAGVERARLSPGEDLFTSLEALVQARAVPGAFFNLLNGSIAELALMTGGPGVDTPMTFHGPIQIATPVAVVAGSGVIGVEQDGSRVSHCHAVFRDRHRRLVGGHLIKGRAIVGSAELDVELMLLANARFVRRTDPETAFVVLHPEAS